MPEKTEFQSKYPEKTEFQGKYSKKTEFQSKYHEILFFQGQNFRENTRKKTKVRVIYPQKDKSAWKNR